VVIDGDEDNGYGGSGWDTLVLEKLWRREGVDYISFESWVAVRYQMTCRAGCLSSA
jgi:hypothetical protein